MIDPTYEQFCAAMIDSYEEHGAATSLGHGIDLAWCAYHAARRLANSDAQP